MTRTTWKIYANMYVFLFLKIIFLLVVICACKIFHINLCFRKGRTCRNKLSRLSVFNRNVVDLYLQKSRSRTMGMSCLSCHDNKTSRSKLKPVRQKINWLQCLMMRYRNRPFPVPRSGSGFLHITPTAEVDFSNRR